MKDESGQRMARISAKGECHFVQRSGDSRRHKCSAVHRPAQAALWCCGVKFTYPSRDCEGAGGARHVSGFLTGAARIVVGAAVGRPLHNKKRSGGDSATRHHGETSAT